MSDTLAPSPKNAAKPESRQADARQADARRAKAGRAKAGRAKTPRRTPDDVLADIGDATSKALSDGDIKTALKGLEMEAKIMGLFKDSSETEADAAPAAQVQIFRIPDNGRQ